MDEPDAHVSCASALFPSTTKRSTNSPPQALEDLVRKKVRDPSDFEWLKQCRFYWRDDRDTVIISICDVDFEYSYEYLGRRDGASCACTLGRPCAVV